MDAELNLAILFSLARYLRDVHGGEALAEAASRAGLDADDVLKGKRWVAVAQIVPFLEYAFDLLNKDEVAFRKAATYRLGEAYGPLRFVLWAFSPKAVFKQAIKNFHVVSSCGGYEILEEGPTWMRLRFQSSKEHNRLLCLMRQANGEAMPTFWGLPPAKLVEDGCLGKGDDACVYHLAWRREQSLWPSIIGLLVGLFTAFVMDTLGLGSAALFAVAPVLGVALGQLYRLHRLNQANIASSQQSLEALEQLARDATEARHAIVAMMGRQRVWTTLMEEQLAEHTRTREKAVETVRKLEEKKVAVVRTYSHDLRSPLTVIRCAVAMLENYGSFGLRRDQAELYKDLAIAVNKMEHILHELMAAVSRETGANRRVPERIDVHAFADQVRRQLRAFAYGRDIRVSAFCTREAPESIETDRLLFDRIMDNLVTNAVKYTEKGSIVVEIDGVPGYLTFKISDTGRGISDDEIDHIFEPGGSSASTRAAESYGIGLSVVVKLLDDIGGLLEVQSKPHVGTTFWVYFPVKVRTTPIPRKTGEDEDESGPITRVVTIRRQADHS